MDSTEWAMPKVRIGDVVLFSKDYKTFDSPTPAFVTGVGDTTISVSAITQAGMMWHASVHHKDDPALHGDHGWQDLGVWEFTDLTKATYAAAASKNNADHPKQGR